MGADDPIFKKYAFGDLNNVRSSLQKRPSAYYMKGTEMVKRSIKDAFREEPFPEGGPYRAQVIWSYGPEQGPPPGYIYDYVEGPDSNLIRLPWVVVRIEELMSNIPNPAKYDPNGSPKEQFLYWTAIKAHFEVGVCFPEVESPDYPQPPRGEFVSVTYTNVKTFSGGKYKVISGDMVTGPMYMSPSSFPAHLRIGTNQNGQILVPPDPIGELPVYPDGCDGYDIDGVKYFAAGDVNSAAVVYYFPGFGNNACSDKRSAIRNLLSTMLPNYFTIAINMESHRSGGSYRGDSSLQSFLRQFENSTPAEFNTVFSGIEAKIIEQITGTPAMIQRARNNVKRVVAVFSAGYMAFDEMYKIHEGAMFSLNGGVVSGIGLLDCNYNSSVNRRAIRLAGESGGNIRVMAVHNNSVRPKTEEARSEFDTNLRNNGGFSVRTDESHNKIPAEFINTVISNIV